MKTEKVQFIDASTQAYALIDELNALISAINFDPSRFQNDPIYVNICDVNYILSSVSFGTLLLFHSISGESFELPTTIQYLEKIREDFFAYCYARKLLV